jgi:succinate-semialdehyde dehydrogenase/glutarate-semialdehyde dehydrogenase
MNRYQSIIESVAQNGGAHVINVENPATEKTIGEVLCVSNGDLESAVGAARVGLQRWRNLRASQCSNILVGAAGHLESDLERHARTLTIETGKTLYESRQEWHRAIETLRWFSTACDTVMQTRIISSDGIRRTLQPQPIGIAALFTPWNYPAVVATRKIASALSAGCSVIIEGSEEAPGATVATADALFSAGLPRDVLGVVFGVASEVSQFLLRKKDIAVLSFTGSTAVGRLLARDAAETLTRCVLELGGHCPVIVCHDADAKDSARAIAAYKFEHAGQSCNAPSRIYVSESTYDAFLESLVEFVDGLVVGDGVCPETTMGPLANRRRLNAIYDLVEDAVQRGASVATGGRRIDRQGYFYAPTVLERVPEAARIMREEPFGPVVVVERFSDLDHAIDLANNTSYGLASYVFSKSEHTAAYAAQRLRSGSIGVNALSGVPPNAPVGGIGDSGYGYEGGFLGIEAFLNLKLISDASAAGMCTAENTN